jgi:hypothetical protein
VLAFPPSRTNLNLSDILSVQYVKHSRVRRFLLEVVSPQQRGSLAIECSRDPAVLVGHALFAISIVLSLAFRSRRLTQIVIPIHLDTLIQLCATRPHAAAAAVNFPSLLGVFDLMSNSVYATSSPKSA